MNAHWITVDERVVDVTLTAATNVHRSVGPGLLESVYLRALSHELTRAGIRHDCEVHVPLIYWGEDLGLAFRADLVVDDQLVVEVKSLRALDHVHFRQVRTYLTLLRMRTGLILNFGYPLLKDGIRRVTVPPRVPSPREDPVFSPRSPRS